jgi:hypothetical protein
MRRGKISQSPGWPGIQKRCAHWVCYNHPVASLWWVGHHLGIADLSGELEVCSITLAGRRSQSVSRGAVSEGREVSHCRFPRRTALLPRRELVWQFHCMMWPAGPTGKRRPVINKHSRLRAKSRTHAGTRERTEPFRDDHPFDFTPPIASGRESRSGSPRP